MKNNKAKFTFKFSVGNWTHIGAVRNSRYVVGRGCGGRRHLSARKTHLWIWDSNPTRKTHLWTLDSNPKKLLKIIT